MTISVFTDRIILSDPWKKYVFSLKEITGIRVVKFLWQKIGIVIQHTSPNAPLYVQFDSLLEKSIKGLVSALEVTGYPVKYQ